MWMHFFLFVVLIILSSLFPPKVGRKNKCFIFLVFVLFFVISAFRSYGVGNDTGEYYRIFRLISSTDSLSRIFTLLRYEPGFIVLNYLITRFTDNYTVMLSLVSGIYLLSVLNFINKHSKDIALSVLLFFSFSLFYDVMITQRQCLAIVIFLFSFDYLVKRKPLKYFFFVMLGACFHFTAMIFGVLYFLPRADFSRAKNIGKWIIIVVSGLFGIEIFVRIFLYFFPYYSHYFNSIYSYGGIRPASIALFIVRLICFCTPMLFGAFKTFYKSIDAKNNVFMQIALLDVLCTFVAIGFNLYDRVEGYFVMGFLLLCTNVCTNIFRADNRMICKVIIVLVPFVFLTAMLIGRADWYGIYPYSFIF